MNLLFGRQFLRPFHLLLRLHALFRLRFGLGPGADRHPADMLLGAPKNIKVMLCFRTYSPSWNVLALRLLSYLVQGVKTRLQKSRGVWSDQVLRGVRS